VPCIVPAYGPYKGCTRTIVWCHSASDVSSEGSPQFDERVGEGVLHLYGGSASVADAALAVDVTGDVGEPSLVVNASRPMSLLIASRRRVGT